MAAPRLVALAAFVPLTIVHTWPLATNPAHLSRNDVGDGLLNRWTAIGQTPSLEPAAASGDIYIYHLRDIAP